jgi:hypothetical protein
MRTHGCQSSIARRELDANPTRSLYGAPAVRSFPGPLIRYSVAILIVNCSRNWTLNRTSSSSCIKRPNSNWRDKASYDSFLQACFATYPSSRMHLLSAMIRGTSSNHSLTFVRISVWSIYMIYYPFSQPNVVAGARRRFRPTPQGHLEACHHVAAWKRNGLRDLAGSLPRSPLDRPRPLLEG